MKKEEKNLNWREPTSERCFYIDLEFQGRIWLDEETYKNYMRGSWAEWKRNERSSRCRVSNGRGGLKRCDKDCKECPYFRNGKSVSLVEIYENYELKIVDKFSSIFEKIYEEERNKAIWDAIFELDEICQKIMKSLSEEFSEREITKVIGMPRATVSYHKKYNLRYNKIKKFSKINVLSIIKWLINNVIIPLFISMISSMLFG